MSFNSDKNDMLVHKKHYNFFFRTEHLCEPCGICSYKFQDFNGITYYV